MPRRSDPVNPALSPSHLLGAHLRHWREKVCGLTLRQVASLAFCDDADLSKWERGLTRPQADTTRRLDDVYGAQGHLFALHRAMTELDRLRTLVKNHPSTEEVATERRRLLQFAATMGIGAANMSGEPIRQLFDMMYGEGRTIEDWQLAVADHLHAIRTRPAAQVHDDLLLDLLALQRQLDAADEIDVTELRRVAAELSAFHASVLTRLGEHAAALRWYRTARRAADSADDLDLRLRIRAHEAAHSLYGLRDPATVLRLVDNALHLAGTAPRPSVGLASLIGAQAHALALLGREDEARRAVRLFTDIASTDLPVVPGFWEPSDYRLYFSQSQAYSALGDETEAGRAQEHILSGPRTCYSIPVRVSLHAALCTVVRGGIDEGVRQAMDLIGTVPRPYLNVMILETARRVLHAVPADRQDRPAVADFRQVLAIAPAKDL